MIWCPRCQEKEARSSDDCCQVILNEEDEDWGSADGCTSHDRDHFACRMVR